MKVPNADHLARPWRIHEITEGFRLEDVWELPTPGGPADLPRLAQMLAGGDPADSSSAIARALWRIRWKLGAILGMDDAEGGVGSRVTSLRERLPADLRNGPSGPEFAVAPFSQLYLTDEEWAAEIANRTVHGIMHIGWVPDGSGCYHARMAVYVRPNGLLGEAYMAGIRPFRHWLVYPPLLRRIGREWRIRTVT